MLRSLVGSEMCIRDRVLPDLKSGEEVRMQSHLNGKWDKQVTVVNKRSEGDSYIVTGKNGQQYIRGRRLLKPISDGEINSNSETEQETPSTVPKMPRRSPRIQEKTREKVEVITVRRTTTEYGRPTVKATPTTRGRAQNQNGKPDDNKPLVGIPYNSCLLYTSPSPRDS